MMKKVKKSVVIVFVNLSRIVLEKIEIIIPLNVFEEIIFKEKSGINRKNNFFFKKLYYKNKIDSFFLTKNLVL